MKGIIKTIQEDPQNAEQRSDEWFAQRLGKFTASTFGDCMSSGRSKDSKFTLTGQSLIREKITEIMTGERKRISGDALEWGTNNEPIAIELYEKVAGVKVKEAPFVILKGYEKWAGGSPDGFIENTKGIIEVKCPFISVNHVEALIENKIPAKAFSKYYTQIQFNILCTGLEFCDFISFDPRMIEDKNKLCVVRIPRNEEYIVKIIERLDLAIAETEKHLAAIKNRSIYNG
jgi:putative phage-type endonuclease